MNSRDLVWLLILSWISSLCGFDDITDLLFNRGTFIDSMGNTHEVENIPHRMIHKESALLSHRNDLRRTKRAHADHQHTVVIAVKQRNLRELERILHDVSDPNSANYGKHLTKAQVRELTTIEGTALHISNYLTLKGISTEEVSEHTEYIRAQGSIQQWEDLLGTEFYEYVQDNDESKIIVRAESYALPETLVEHVYAVFNTVQFPDPSDFSKAEKWRRVEENLEPLSSDVTSNIAQVLVSGYVTPALLSNFYNITNNTAVNGLGSQGLYETIGQTFSPSDLTYFQTYFHLPKYNVTHVINNHSSNSACATSLDNCAEANLDVQYIMAVAQNVPTTYYYWAGSDFMLDWITEVAAMTSPPLVFSISYGTYEQGVSSSYMSSFDAQAMKLGAMGVTVLASSGDDGAPGNQARNNPNRCGYYPSFPASSQYVTAVGGTQGPESGTTEIACQGDQGGLITSGGGFSAIASMPSWQSTQVAAYFANVTGTTKAPTAGYNSNGRGYPDVSLAAKNYLIMANKGSVGVYGTSASCPVFAGFVSLVNAKRLNAGKSSLGWINPSLYAYSSYFVNDITSGTNNCVLNGEVCCSHGFSATTGWDPVTGLGSVNYGKFEWAFLNLVGNYPNSPTVTPSVVPGDPTAPPSRAPSNRPSVKPTQSPSLSSGYLYQTTYSAKNCTGGVPLVQGVATNQCFFAYSGTTIVAFVKVVCNSVYATLSIYLRSDCSSSFLYSTQKIFLGCAKEVNFRGTKSVSYQCSNGGTTLPLPTSSYYYATQQTYTSTTGCTGNVATFVSFKEDSCVSLYSGSTSYSYKLSYPNLNRYSGSSCSGTATSSTASTSCASGYLDSSTLSNYGYSYSDDNVLNYMKAYSKWVWQLPSPSAAPTLTFSPSAAPSILPTKKPTVDPTIRPSKAPTVSPSVKPSQQPSELPSLLPSEAPTAFVSFSPSLIPTDRPSTELPSCIPSASPSERPSCMPSVQPSISPSAAPSVGPSVSPSQSPSVGPTLIPSIDPSICPTVVPTIMPSVSPSQMPTESPSLNPTILPSIVPSTAPSLPPSVKPSDAPSVQPSAKPTYAPTQSPSMAPSTVPSLMPSADPSINPSRLPTVTPSVAPSIRPSVPPTLVPTVAPSLVPTSCPSLDPTITPSSSPTTTPTVSPTVVGATGSPSEVPSLLPSQVPTFTVTLSPTTAPSVEPSVVPTIEPSLRPSTEPSGVPSDSPSHSPTVLPSWVPSIEPSRMPSVEPSLSPSMPPSMLPTECPSVSPSNDPSLAPTAVPSLTPSAQPSINPSVTPSDSPTTAPVLVPTIIPSVSPSLMPIVTTSEAPSFLPSTVTTFVPSYGPFVSPTSRLPSVSPSRNPSAEPSLQPSVDSVLPSLRPSPKATEAPTDLPSAEPTGGPSEMPSLRPYVVPTDSPSVSPTLSPTGSPTCVPSDQPSLMATAPPSRVPSICPSLRSSMIPSTNPALTPTGAPRTGTPTFVTTEVPTVPGDVSDTYQFSVTQVLNGLSYADYLTHSDDTNSALCYAVVTSMDTTQASCTVASVTESSSRRRLMRLLSAGLSVLYDIQFIHLASSGTSPNATYQALVYSLTNATSNGIFQSALQTYALQFNLSALLNVTSASLTASGYTALPSDDDPGSSSSSKSSLNALAIGLIAAGGFVTVLLVCYGVNRRNLSNGVIPFGSRGVGQSEKVEIFKRRDDGSVSPAEVEGGVSVSRSPEFTGVVVPFDEEPSSDVGMVMRL